MTPHLTEWETALLNAWQAGIDADGKPPSLPQLAQQLDCSLANVLRLVQLIEAKGIVLRRVPEELGGEA